MYVQQLSDSKSQEITQQNQDPPSKLVLRNLSTGRIIYEEKVGDSYLYDSGFWLERGVTLVVINRGGSGNSINVLEVNEYSARSVLIGGYRESFTIIPNDKLGGDLGFLLIDSDSPSEPLEARLYQYSKEDKKFVLIGKVDLAKFIQSLRAQFKKIST